MLRFSLAPTRLVRDWSADIQPVDVPTTRPDTGHFHVTFTCAPLRLGLSNVRRYRVIEIVLIMSYSPQTAG
jgi:hypothetical protein